MAKKPNFANELDSIANSVEADVDRVINILRDGNSPQSTAVDRSKVPSHRKSTLTTEAKRHDRSDGKRQMQPLPVHRQPIDDVAEEERILENVTTRLTRNTNQRLTEAALRQRLAKRTPDSRQAIIETAVNDWLERNGYL